MVRYVQIQYSTIRLFHPSVYRVYPTHVNNLSPRQAIREEALPTLSTQPWLDNEPARRRAGEGLSNRSVRPSGVVTTLSLGGSVYPKPRPSHHRLDFPIPTGYC